MLEQWLQTLEQERQKAVDRVRTVCTDEKTIALAIKEIDINCITVRQWLRRMHNKGYKLNDDLSEIREDYTRFEEYRGHYNHISHHLGEIRTIPVKIEEGKFEAIFARDY